MSGRLVTRYWMQQRFGKQLVEAGHAAGAQTLGRGSDVVVAVPEDDVRAEQSPIGACLAFVWKADTAGVHQPPRAYLAVELMVGVADHDEIGIDSGECFCRC